MLKVLLRLARDLFALFVQQQDFSTDTKRRAGLSAIAEPPVRS